MKLRDLINAIEACGDERTIFAEKIDGRFQESSEAIVIEMTDDELRVQTTEVAKRRCPGKSYFLEVLLVKEILEGWASNHRGAPPSLEAACRCLIWYAEKDAYPEEFFG